MEFLSLHHIGIPVTDFKRAEAFYMGVLGLTRHPIRSNWLCFKGSNPLHLMPVKQPEPKSPNPHAQHFALHVERLEDILELLLRHGLKPFQQNLEMHTRSVTTQDDTLDWGIGTLMIEDPDGNTVEFIQVGRGIFSDDLAVQLPAAHQPSTAERGGR